MRGVWGYFFVWDGFLSVVILCGVGLKFRYVWIVLLKLRIDLGE